MKVTLNKLFSGMRELEATDNGLTEASKVLEAHRGTLNMRLDELAKVIGEKEGTDVECFKAKSEISSIEQEMAKLCKASEAVQSAKDTLKNLKTIIGRIDSIEDGNIMFDTKVLSCLVTKGIGKYTTYEFEQVLDKTMGIESQDYISGVDEDIVG